MTEKGRIVMRQRAVRSVLVTVATAWCLMGARPAAAEVVFNTWTNSGPITLFSPCTGEAILLNFDVHSVGIRKGDEIEVKTNIHGTGIGLTSGSEYTINNTVQSTRAVFPGVCGIDIVAESHSRLISKGGAPNQELRIISHSTRADGPGPCPPVTVTILGTVLECRG